MPHELELNGRATVERFTAAAEYLEESNYPLPWGKYTHGKVAVVRANEFTHSRNNTPGLKFTSKTLADGAYVFAYVDDGQLGNFDIRMTLEEWQDLRVSNG